MFRKAFLILGSLFFGGVWLARKCGVKVGEGCRIYTTQWGSEPFLIEIGNRVTITSGVKFLTHDGATWLVRNESGRYQRYGKITIGDNVFVGVNAIIMPGVTIGQRVIIGAGSVVSKDVPSGSVVAGVPAKFISSFEEYERKVMVTCAHEDELRDLSYFDKVNLALKLQYERKGK